LKNLKRKEILQKIKISLKGGVHMKKIPVGINDFKTLIENNYYYIDKIKHIEDLLEDGSEEIF